MDKNVFVTKDGHRIPLRRVAPILIEKVRQGVVLPSPPTYEVEVVGGDKETHLHDATTLETDEDRAAWAAYEKAQSEANGQMMERILRLLFVRATGDVLPADNSWAVEQAYLGIDVPVEPLDRKVHFIQTELLTHAEDISDFMVAAMGLIGVGEEVIQAAEATFRPALRQGWEDAGADSPEPAADREMVAQPDIRGDGGSEGVGADAGRVGRPRRRR